MHSMYAGIVPEHVFAPLPPTATTRASTTWAAEVADLFEQHADEIAAVIVEPLLQGAGGMRPWPARCVDHLSRLAREHGALVIHDEIATGFWRTGTALAQDRLEERADIVCVGKALTGGYLTLAATLCTAEVAQRVSDSPAGAMMHGPTFMGNPLACAVANASLDLLASYDNDANIRRIESGLRRGLAPAADAPGRGRRTHARRRRRGRARQPGGRAEGHRARARPRRLGAAVPQPRLHDAAVRHLRRGPRHHHDAPSARWWRDRLRALALRAGPAARGRRADPPARPPAPVGAGHRPGRQRLPRPRPAPARRRGRGRGRPGVRRRRRRLTPRHRDPDAARGARAGARHVHRVPRCAGVLDRLPRQPLGRLGADRRRHPGRLGRPRARLDDRRLPAEPGAGAGGPAQRRRRGRRGPGRPHPAARGGAGGDDLLRARRRRSGRASSPRSAPPAVRCWSRTRPTRSASPVPAAAGCCTRPGSATAPTSSGR